MFRSWGNYPKLNPAHIIHLNWRDEDIEFSKYKCDFLAYGQGRSYGDSCLNENGTIVTTKKLNRFLNFDPKLGVLECESGTTFAEILNLIVPSGWFLPVVPGTKYVSLGGAIANDIHGKNHHVAGTLGKHVLSFELLRSNGQIITCSSQSNTTLYQATIGGLGLTGIILSAKLQLKPISSNLLEVEYIKFKNLDEFFAYSKLSEEKFEYTVAWLDCITAGKNFGRGILMCANHVQTNNTSLLLAKPKKKFTLPAPPYVPEFFLNRISMQAFNNIYFNHHSRKLGKQVLHYENFFFQLDAIKNWNKIYGKAGFLQYQLVIPAKHFAAIKNILTLIISAKQVSFLSVLKMFGVSTSPGLLSFPIEGVTLALDFPYRGTNTLALLHELDAMIMDCGGRVYPAKDARMSSLAFKTFFPLYTQLLAATDPQFSSSFWRRVMQDDK